VIRIGVGPGASESKPGNHGLTVRVWPNTAAGLNTIALSTRRLTNAPVTVSLTMQGMAMGTQTFHLVERRPGLYTYGGALLMPGQWNLKFTIARSHQRPQLALVVDQVGP
jgi:hypothetical protein